MHLCSITACRHPARKRDTPLIVPSCAKPIVPLSSFNHSSALCRVTYETESRQLAIAFLSSLMSNTRNRDVPMAKTSKVKGGSMFSVGGRLRLVKGESFPFESE